MKEGRGRCKGDNITQSKTLGGARLFALHDCTRVFQAFFPTLPLDFDRTGRVNDTRITLNAPLPRSFYSAALMA